MITAGTSLSSPEMGTSVSSTLVSVTEVRRVRRGAGSGVEGSCGCQSVGSWKVRVVYVSESATARIRAVG